MTVVPIAQYLVQFGAGDAFELQCQPRDEASQLQNFDPKALEELARKIEDAQTLGREEGRQEGRAAAAAEFDIELANERARCETRIASERLTWLAEEGRRMSGIMETAFRELETSLAGSVARILKPFIIEALRDQMLTQLSATMSNLLTGEHGLIRVSGPESLLDALRKKLQPNRDSIEYLAAEGVEIRVVADQTVVESQLQAWIDRFNQATD